MSDRAHVATRKGLFTLERNNGAWRLEATAFLGDPVTMVLEDPRTDTLFAALNLGHFGVKLHRSSDRGRTWEECAAPSYAREERTDKAGEAGEHDPDAPTVHQIWALETAGADQGAALWAGTIPGGLFRSNDGGDSWRLIESLWDHPDRKNWFGGGYDHPGIHSIAVDPRDSRRMTLGVSCGGVWVTSNAGQTWETRCKGMFADYMPPERREDPSVQDPHRLVQCPATPEALWVQHHNGIFRSTDGGARWESIEAAGPSTFGFAVAVHPTDPETAWFVPAVKDECRIPADGKVVVTRTRDGGRSFDVLRHGLPQELAYDLVFRHALDVDSSGERLICGSTTGNLWASDDGGDRWVSLASSLPPIYQVRFAS